VLRVGIPVTQYLFTTLPDTHSVLLTQRSFRTSLHGAPVRISQNEAVCRHGNALKQVADHIGLHYARVRRLVSVGRSSMLNCKARNQADGPRAQ
jgi:hypothetical protein